LSRESVIDPLITLEGETTEDDEEDLLDFAEELEDIFEDEDSIVSTSFMTQRTECASRSSSLLKEATEVK
jgi:hypothetical protein